MIKFDKHGNPTPPGIIDITIEEFESEFVVKFTNSKTRKEIFEKYNSYISDFRKEICTNYNHWINGSYTTKKENPNDIDLAFFFEWTDEMNAKAEAIKPFCFEGGSKKKYLVDGYFVPVYPRDDPRYTVTEEWMKYWKNQFGYDRTHRPKAIFNINFK